MFSERFASSPLLELTEKQEGDGANRHRMGRNDTAMGGSTKKDNEKSVKEGTQRAPGRGWKLHIYIEGERIQIAEESSRSSWPQTTASDLSVRSDFQSISLRTFVWRTDSTTSTSCKRKKEKWGVSFYYYFLSILPAPLLKGIIGKLDFSYKHKY